MRKTILMCFCLIALNAFTSQAAESNLQVIPVDQLTQDMLNALMEGKHPDAAVEFPAHTLIPVGFFLKGDLVELAQGRANCGQVEFKQRVYARNTGGSLLFSSNLQEWKPLFMFITGNASVALSIENEKPSLLFGAEVNRRD